MEREQCQIGGCQNPAKYSIYKTYPDGKNRWLHVCKEHEKEIGDENVRSSGEYSSK